MQLRDPSFVVLRIENAGTAPIEKSDYLSNGDDDPGIEVSFTGRPSSPTPTASRPPAPWPWPS